MDKTQFIKTCNQLLEAYETGLLGQTVMPEDSNLELKRWIEKIASRILRSRWHLTISVIAINFGKLP